MAQKKLSDGSQVTVFKVGQLLGFDQPLDVVAQPARPGEVALPHRLTLSHEDGAVHRVSSYSPRAKSN